MRFVVRLHQSCRGVRTICGGRRASATATVREWAGLGISPKLLARILRFNRAVELSATPLAWAEVSQTCGYYDQAHMVRDFQQFSGYSPTEFARRRLPKPMPQLKTGSTANSRVGRACSTLIRRRASCTGPP